MTAKTIHTLATGYKHQPEEFFHLDLRRFPFIRYDGSIERQTQYDHRTNHWTEIFTLAFLIRRLCEFYDFPKEKVAQLIIS